MKSDLRLALLISVLWLTAANGCRESTSSSDDINTDSSPGNATDEISTEDTDTEDSIEDTNTGDSDEDTDLPSLRGWISAIEWNDTCDQWYMKTDWVGGVRAYFAESATYPRALPHTLDFIPMTAAEGNCRLYDAGLIKNCFLPQECFECIDPYFECTNGLNGERWCDQDEQCEGDTEGGTCQPLPPHSNLGIITLSGFKEQLILKPDEYDRYYVESLTNPNDLFDDDDVLTAETEGGTLPPLSFSTKGTAPLEIENAVVELSFDHPAEVRWTPADPDSRIEIAIMSGSHDPNPLTAEILCDVPDGDGSVEIPANLVNAFLEETCTGMMKCSRITRYTRDVKPIGDKEIELFVGSARNLSCTLY